MAERVNGPYKHYDRFRIVIVGSDGSQVAESYGSREAAEKAKAEYLKRWEQRTVSQAIEDYIAHMRERGLRDGTVQTAGYRLRALHRVGEGCDRLLANFTPSAARELYSQRTAEVKPDTHHGELSISQQAGEWWLKQGWVRRNPWAGIEPVGRRTAGKPQLRVDEARRFMNACLQECTPVSIGAALALIGGLRASEVVDRVVRDVDDGGRLMWIPIAKTRAGVRQLVIPEVLRPHLLSLCAGKGPADKVWTISRHTLRHHVIRLCGASGVQRVTPHGLRGLHATIGVGTGVALEHVARALGHADVSVTRRHYLAPGIEAEAADRRLAELFRTTAHAPESVHRAAYAVISEAPAITAEEILEDEGG